jgi:hypothetical protein
MGVYRHGTLWLSRDELAETVRNVLAALQSSAANKPARGRARTAQPDPLPRRAPLADGAIASSGSGPARAKCRLWMGQARRPDLPPSALSRHHMGQRCKAPRRDDEVSRHGPVGQAMHQPVRGPRTPRGPNHDRHLGHRTGTARRAREAPPPLARTRLRERRQPRPGPPAFHQSTRTRLHPAEVGAYLSWTCPRPDSSAAAARAPADLRLLLYSVRPSMKRGWDEPQSACFTCSRWLP